MKGIVTWLVVIGVSAVLFVVFGGIQNRMAIIIFVIVAVATSIIVAFLKKR